MEIQTITLAGTEVKVAIRIDWLGVDMDDYEFTCEFFTTTAETKVTLAKSELVRVNENEYIAVVDTTGMRSGNIRMRVFAQIPDEDCSDGYRQEKIIHTTDIYIKGFCG